MPFTEKGISFLHEFDGIFYDSRWFPMESSFLLCESDGFDSRMDELERDCTIGSYLDTLLYRSERRERIVFDDVADTPYDNICFLFGPFWILSPFWRNNPPVNGRMTYLKHGSRFSQTVENVIDVDGYTTTINCIRTR